jgi:glycosyltransferase involved in cell wall biosynthesis
VSVFGRNPQRGRNGLAGFGSQLVSWERRSSSARILTVTNVWPHPARPAYGPFVRRCVDQLAARGVDSDVLFIRGYRGKRAYIYAAAIVLAAQVRRKRYRVVHSHGGEAALVARMYLASPVVASYLGSDLLASSEGCWRLRMRCLARSTILRRHAALMTATTTKTQEMEAKLPRRARVRNRVIPDGVDLDRFAPMGRDLARRRLGWAADAPIVLFAGRAEWPGKRLWLAKQAVNVARKELEDLELVVASGVDPDEMPCYYSAADCLLHTSASEGSPNVIKEALACNLPIVATPAGDIRQLVAGVRPGGVVSADARSLASKVVECCREPMRSNGRTAAARLSLEKTTAATAALYASLLHPAGDTAAILDRRLNRPVG